MAVLGDYRVLDSVPEAALDDIAFLASHICGAPIALVSLVDESRQWFKAKVGTDVAETPRDVAFCAHAILEPGDLFVIPDALEDPRFATNPLVLGDPHTRFYAGAALVSPEGLPLGTLCVFDTAPRPGGLTASQARALGALARQVMIHLELRRIVAAINPSAVEAPNADLALGSAVHDELQAASHAAANASALMAEAMERALDAEVRMHNLIDRVRAIQRRPLPASAKSVGGL
jgi:GAF domain-containing protein